MEFFSHFVTAFSDAFDGFIGAFTAMFEYFISIGVRQEALIIILIGGGLSFLILLVALFMTLSRVKLRRGPTERPIKTTDNEPDNNIGAKNKTRFSEMFRPKNQPSDEADNAAFKVGPKGGPKVEGKGFTIFKKRKSPPRPVHSAPNEHNGDAGVDQVLSQLAEIERDMLALKELFQSGHIKVEVYVAETRSLYEKAKALS